MDLNCEATARLDGKKTRYYKSLTIIPAACLAIQLMFLILAGLGCGGSAYAPVVDTWRSGETTVTLYEDGKLRVSGVDEMANYGYKYDPPWQDFKSRITAVVIEKGVVRIGDQAFYGCENIKSVTIPNSMIYIQSYAFCGCKALTSVMIPSSVRGIANGVFLGCSSLTSINVSKGNKQYVSIDGVIFARNTKKQALLKRLVSKNNETLTLLQYPPGRLGASYTIPGNVTNIGPYAFVGSAGLTSITLPSSTVDYAWEHGPFVEECINLTSINVDDDNPKYRSIDGVLFNKEATTLIRSPEGRRGAYAIPDGVTEIGDYAFQSNAGLTSVTIPNGVTRIGYEAFAGCTTLMSVRIPSGVTSIGAAAFGYCKALTSVTIPSSVTSIGALGFDFCDNLTSVTSLNPTPPDIIESSYAFRGLSENAVLYVPKGSEDAYRNTEGWKVFKNIQKYVPPVESELVTAKSDNSVSDEEEVSERWIMKSDWKDVKCKKYDEDDGYTRNQNH